MESGPPCSRSDPTPTGERGTSLSLWALCSHFSGVSLKGMCCLLRHTRMNPHQQRIEGLMSSRKENHSLTASIFKISAIFLCCTTSAETCFFPLSSFDDSTTFSEKEETCRSRSKLKELFAHVTACMKTSLEFVQLSSLQQMGNVRSVTYYC